MRGGEKEGGRRKEEGGRRKEEGGVCDTILLWC
jgi:hypothetical protein